MENFLFLKRNKLLLFILCGKCGFNILLFPSCPVPPAVHDDLPGVDCGWVPPPGEAGAKAHHPDASPVPNSDSGRLLHPRQEHDTQGGILMLKCYFIAAEKKFCFWEIAKS